MPPKDGRIVLAWLMLVAVSCGRRPSAAESTGSETTTDVSTGTSSDTTSSESGTSSGTESGTDGGGTFFPDLPEVPVFCDPWLQDCAEGEKCVPTAPTHEPAFEGPEQYEFKCVPILGDQAPGEMCMSSGHQDGLDNCDETSSCWNLNEIDGELVGTCHPMCTGSADDPQCIEGGYCEMWGQDGITLCVWNCDPLVQDCGPDMACYYDGPLFSCFFAGSAPVNAPCGDIPYACAEGLVCLYASVLPDCEAEGCCAPICDTDLGDEQCAAVRGTSCVPISPQPIPGYERVGFCMLPDP